MWFGQRQHNRATKRKGNKIKPSLQQQPLKKVGSQQRGRESWWRPSLWSRGQADPEADHIPLIIIDKTTNLLHLNMSATLLKKSERWEKRQLLSVKFQFIFRLLHNSRSDTAENSFTGRPNKRPESIRKRRKMVVKMVKPFLRWGYSRPFQERCWVEHISVIASRKSATEAALFGLGVE